MLAGKLQFAYMPILSGAVFDLWQAGVFLMYLTLCAMPVIINGNEDWKWKLRQKQQKTTLLLSSKT